MGCQEDEAVKTDPEYKEERKEVSIHNENENHNDDWELNNFEFPGTSPPTKIIPNNKK